VTEIKGYKAFLPDLTSKEGRMQYEVGKEYKTDKKISLCSVGFHFCAKAVDVFEYYLFSPNNRVCEVTALGNVIKRDDKSVTDHIRIDRELTWHEVLDLCNTGKGCTGRHNSGDGNSGNRNSGYANSGYANSGDGNSGNRNSGDWNSGNRNSGNRNSGDWNSGNRNSGYANSGDGNSGVFCTAQPKLTFFDAPSDVTYDQFVRSEAYDIMCRIRHNIWVWSSDMTDDEKKEHPEHETTGGFIRRHDLKTSFGTWWNELDDRQRGTIKALPNFDAAKFEIITEIKEERL